MGTPIPREKALFFSGALYTKEDYYLEACALMEGRFGEILMESAPMPWVHTDYYRKELGQDIYRRFVFFRTPFSMDRLAAAKLATNDIEKSLSSAGKRNINLDPGYMTPAKVVLASTKDFCHRIYLSDDIYAEVTLMYIRGEFVPQLNTYNDYKAKNYHQVFHAARKLIGIIKNTEPVSSMPMEISSIEACTLKQNSACQEGK